MCIRDRVFNHVLQRHVGVPDDDGAVVPVVSEHGCAVLVSKYYPDTLASVVVQDKMICPLSHTGLASQVIVISPGDLGFIEDPMGLYSTTRLLCELGLCWGGDHYQVRPLGINLQTMVLVRRALPVVGPFLHSGLLFQHVNVYGKITALTFVRFF